MDDKGKPDQKKIIDGIMKNTSGRELQNFIQKTFDDCFELLEKGEIKFLDTCGRHQNIVSFDNIYLKLLRSRISISLIGAESFRYY